MLLNCGAKSGDGWISDETFLLSVMDLCIWGGKRKRMDRCQPVIVNNLNIYNFLMIISA